MTKLNLKKQIQKLQHYKKIHNLKLKITFWEKRALKKNIPIQKIVGFINFDNLRIYVKKKVFIPRFETQEVVHKAIEFINFKSKVLDLATGSGYIGLTIKHKTNANVFLSDISKNAIKQAKKNAQINNLQVKIIHSDLFENIKEKFDVIVCNPPYINFDFPLDKNIINFEPHIALFADDNGNEFYKKIIKQIHFYLKKNGILIFEISDNNVSFLKKNNFQIFKDINNKNRIAIKKF